MNNFFHRYWWLYYLLVFLLLGLLIYLLFWRADYSRYENKIAGLENDLSHCAYQQRTIDSLKQVINDMQTPTQDLVQCNQAVNSGGQGQTVTNHDLGSVSGVVVVEYDMKTIPDQMIVTINGIVVASTNGLVSDYGKLSFNYTASSGRSTYCTVTVSAPDQNTSWEYRLNCPN